MGLRANPTQRQRRLGEELRKLRETSGLSATEAGGHAGLGRAHMSHIETGRTAIPEGKLRSLTEAYGCARHPYIDGLVEMSQATGRGWWSTYKSSHDARALDLAELEASATAHRSFQWMYVPGPLQTPEYMRALFESDPSQAGSELTEKYVEFRQRRQGESSGGGQNFHAVIHEAALHMQFAPADVMRRQIEHLVDAAELPHVRIQLLPFKSDVYPATPGSPFSIFDAVVPELGTVYVEHPLSSAFLSDQEHLAQYTSAFERLSAAALPALDPRPGLGSHTRKDSLQLIHHLLYVL